MMEKPRHVTFDAHAHVMTPSRLRSGWKWVQRSAPKGTVLDKAPSPEEMVTGLREAGIAGYFNLFFPVFPGTSREVNEWNGKFCAEQPGALPLLSLHPGDSPQERQELVAEFLLRRNFAGLKIHSYIQQIRLDEPWLPDVCAVLEQKRRVLLVHTGFSRFYGSEYSEEEMAEHLVGLLEAFPNLAVIAAHMLYPRMDLAFQFMGRYPNLFLDTAGIPTRLRHDGQVEVWMPSWEQYADRILFGSDYGLRPDPIVEVVRRFESLPLSENALRLIGGEAALRLVKSLAKGWKHGQAHGILEAAPRSQF